jgi:hypothetical protein
MAQRLNAMKVRSRNVVALALLLFFASAIWCATLAAPGQALASVSGCSQMPGAMAMAGCAHPSYLCGFDSASNRLSQGALSSARSSDLLKNALGLALGTASVDVSIGLASPGAREWKNVSLAEQRKVSIRLFNSILNL